MSKRSWPARVALWAAAASLLLTAALPLLAAVAAQSQGLALGEVCSVYGVAGTARDEGADAGHAAKHAAPCALAAAAMLGAPPATRLPGAAAPDAGPVLVAGSRAPVHDRSARWFARLRHGPPAA